MQEQLSHYLGYWGLSNPKHLATTVIGEVYTVQSGAETVVLKLYNPFGAQEEHAAVYSLRHFDGRGAVRLLREEPDAILMEYAEGEPLLEMVKRGGDAEATAIIGDVLNELHAAPISTPPEGLIPLKTWFRSLFARAKEPGQHAIFGRGAGVAERLLDHPRGDLYVLHGDIHHENVRHSRRGWLAIDPKAIYGERTYDTANTLCNPPFMPELVENEARLLRNAGILADKIGLPVGRVINFAYAYACLSGSWWLEGEGNIDAANSVLHIAELLEPHLSEADL